MLLWLIAWNLICYINSASGEQTAGTYKNEEEGDVAG